MAYIYIIKNDINNKVYIGKTIFSIEKRWKEHLIDARKNRREHRPLYYAINKYGEKHFYIELLEECDIDKASEREIYWINYFNSYKNGYNATLGGDGKIYLDYKKILQLIDTTNFSQKEIANFCQCCEDSVRNIAHLYRPDINWYIRSQNNSRKNLIAQPKKVKCIETQQIFNSITEAQNWLIKEGKTKSKGASSSISAVCKKKRKTAYGYHWTYA